VIEPQVSPPAYASGGGGPSDGGGPSGLPRRTA